VPVPEWWCRGNEFGRTPGETGDARRRADKRSRGWALRQRLPFGRGDDAPPPLHRVVDAATGSMKS